MASSCRNLALNWVNCGLYTVYNHNSAILYSKKGSIVAAIWQIPTIYAELYIDKFLLAYTLYNVNPVSAWNTTGAGFIIIIISPNYLDYIRFLNSGVQFFSLEQIENYTLYIIQSPNTPYNVHLYMYNFN